MSDDRSYDYNVKWIAALTRQTTASLEEFNGNLAMNYDSHELILYDVRCFQGEQYGRCKPITLLVGENSTGKITVPHPS